MFRYWSLLAGLLGAIGVAVAAWSSHGLPHLVPADQLAVALERARAATLHHMLHTLALLGVALWARQGGNALLHLAGALFVAGIAGFSGGIYLRLATGIDSGPLVYVVPVGGSCLILGWLALGVAGWLQKPSR
ncbi:DUF423 domain-containing protein [Azoarcus indigens]|uniref:Uncharacterized membrane protein YgdD (TMEM256/DUF423 family) n=1 Tax=Azoarcus indigens TaxID=29545 RepID=A0A4R6DL74_9RHOO|nr:DUF423 domain-containing protein [Azoarcus indigens]NMG66954.1 DUF423 domain-containing protein [Azoarcus indigens]TDN44999.1 uncharacterized membrane protein YgdD (TMEM256/DUF423 family) [Azoarcus indigens]